MPGDIHSMKHWKLSKMPTPESPPVIFQTKPCARTGRKKTAESNQREVLADHAAKLNASWGCSIQRMHNDGKRFTVIADDKLTAFLELERVTRDHCASKMPNNSALCAPCSFLTASRLPEEMGCPVGATSETSAPRRTFVGCNTHCSRTAPRSK